MKKLYDTEEEKGGGGQWEALEGQMSVAASGRDGTVDLLPNCFSATQPALS